MKELKLNMSFFVFQFGKTKMFVKKTAMDRLDHLTRESQRKVTTAQSGK